MRWRNSFILTAILPNFNPHRSGLSDGKIIPPTGKNFFLIQKSYDN